MREFNTALLGKWCWRLLVDRVGMWYRVLVARYDEVAGRLAGGGQRGFVWWREVSKICDGESAEGG
ncbi:non-LTR retrotransposon transposase [Trifolium medium]|uniref:Non-LTR retrotransposon transposase n=1 Tax=Trifolium medium TaxID=97028 RepID=A0A392V114_9FABA|nr:non-LTR retrotransposon transposase [Trifolium medium]